MKVFQYSIIILNFFILGCIETPVKFYNCNSQYKNCILSARFDDLESCEWHKVFFEAYCDYISVPGKIICDITKTSDISSSYCTK